MAKGPLEGIKVLDLTSWIAGPYCAKLMADMGADVIKVESPEGDPARLRGPFKDNIPNRETAAGFLFDNTNKKGITLNIETKEGQKLLKKLAQDADVLLEDKKPGKMGELGLGYEDLKAVNDKLVMASVTPFGQYGPYSNYKAYDLQVYHGSGAGYVLPANSPDDSREPLRGGGMVAQRDTGACLLVAVLAAVYHVLMGGNGQYIDMSKQEAEMALERMNIVRYYELGKNPSRVKINRLRDTLLKCGDGGYVKVVLHPDKQWNGVVKALGAPKWTNLPQFADHNGREINFEELTDYLNGEAAKYGTDELFNLIQAQGTACAPICTAEQVYKSPQSEARKFFVEMDHPAAGTLKYPGLPFRMSVTPSADNHAAPLLGQDNEYIYCGKLGLAKEQVVKLAETGVI